MKNRFFDRLLWVDVEFTTIDYEKSKIMEFAAIVTDENLNEITKAEWVINHPGEVIEELNNFKLGNVANKPELKGLSTVYELHERSGLLKKVKDSDMNTQQVEAEVVDFVKKNVGDSLVIMAGNSIHADRQVIRNNWPKLEALLHYRMIDVSSFKLIYANNGLEFAKKSTHRALDDIEESIAELKFYLKGSVIK